MSSTHHLKSIVASASIAIGSAGIGSVLAYSSPTIPDLNLSAADASLMASGSTVAMLVGAVAGGPLIDSYGRKGAAMFSSLPFVIGWLLIGASRNVNLMQVGRIITGLSSGVINVAVPVYVAEISEPSIRGLVGSGHELFVNIGMLYAYAFGMIFHWNYLAIVCAVLPVAMAVSLLLMPESPRWLVARGNRQEALEALQWLRPSATQSVETELTAIEEAVARHAAEEFRWTEFSRPALYKPLAIVVGLMFLQEFSGFAAITEYTESIFASAAEKDDGKSSDGSWDPRVQTTVVGALGVVANGLSALVVDKAGRRVMLVISAIGMTVGMSALAIFFTVKCHVGADVTVDHIGWLPTVSMIVFVFSVSIGYGPVPFYLASEMFPLRARGVAGGLSVAAVCLSTSMVAFCFPYLLEAFHSQGVYWIFVAFSVCSIAFVLVVPETKGRSLEDIENIFS